MRVKLFFMFAAFLMSAMFHPYQAYTQESAHWAGIVKGADFKRLLNRPELIESDVSMLPGEGGDKWIRMTADVHTVSELPLEQLYSVLTDFDDYPQVFKRYRLASVAGEAAEGKYVNYTLGVKLLWHDYLSTFTALFAEPAHSSSSIVIEITQVAGDGSVRNIFASWFLAAVTVDGKPCTYIRFFDSNESKQQVGGQLMAMKMSVNGEHTAALEQLIRRCSGRAPTNVTLR